MFGCTKIPIQSGQTKRAHPVLTGYYPVFVRGNTPSLYPQLPRVVKGCPKKNIPLFTYTVGANKTSTPHCDGVSLLQCLGFHPIIAWGFHPVQCTQHSQEVRVHCPRTYPVCGLCDWLTVVSDSWPLIGLPGGRCGYNALPLPRKRGYIVPLYPQSRTYPQADQLKNFT